MNLWRLKFWSQKMIWIPYVLLFGRGQKYCFCTITFINWKWHSQIYLKEIKRRNNFLSLTVQMWWKNLVKLKISITSVFCTIRLKKLFSFFIHRKWKEKKSVKLILFIWRIFCLDFLDKKKLNSSYLH